MFISAKPVPGVPAADAHRGPGASKRSADDAAPGRQKCPRRSSVATRSSCGFGMPGTDHPTLDLDDIRSDPVAGDVREMVRQRMASGASPLRIGEVFFGEEHAYRVVRVAGGEVMLANLNAAETRRAKREAMEGRLRAVYSRVVQEAIRSDEAGFAHRTPHIPVPRLLAATRAWQLLDSCDASEERAPLSIP
jgi:hypothetical protein